MSENMKWRVRKNFAEGKPWSGTILGYRLVDGRYVVVPHEAEIVRRIYSEYLSGKGIEAIARGLNADGAKSRRGGAWDPSVVRIVLRNYSYTGNLILQKTYRENHITKRKMINDGVLPKYHVESSHEAIIDAEVFEAVQREIERRTDAVRYTKPGSDRYPFRSLIVCGNCGAHYKRKIRRNGAVWICSTYNRDGKDACPSKQIPEERLLEMTADIDMNAVKQMVAENGNVVRILFSDGSEAVKHWEDRSRAGSWTDDMKKTARLKALGRSDLDE